MIAVKLQGRLGNQLFQYAFAYATAKRLKTSFYLDKSIYSFKLPEYFKVKTDFVTPLDQTVFSIRGYKGFFSRKLKLKFYRLLHKKLLLGNEITISNYEAVADNLTLLKDDALYTGFFQSEDYFEDVKGEIRSLFQIKASFLQAFNEIQQKLSGTEKRVVVHIRRGDYLDLEWSLPLEYYKKAIDLANGPGTHFIFISDDQAFIEKEFAYVPNKYVSTHNEIIDLQFLMSGDVCILSNSSFSWWGAWLNSKPCKKIIAPKFWLGYGKGKEYPVDIMQPGWTII